MTNTIIFWAQALDNSSPDHIYVNGQEVSSDNIVLRQEAVSCVSSVIKLGHKIFASQGVQLTADRHHFVFEVPSVQLDVAGRIAPIVFFGPYDLGSIDSLVSSVAYELEEFAKRIDRSIKPEHLELAQDSFAALKKKTLKRRTVRGVTIGVSALAIVALAYWLVSRT